MNTDPLTADTATVARRARRALEVAGVVATVRTVRDLDGFSRVVLVGAPFEHAGAVADVLRGAGVPSAWRCDYRAGEAECSVAVVDCTAPRVASARSQLMHARHLSLT